MFIDVGKIRGLVLVFMEQALYVEFGNLYPTALSLVSPKTQGVKGRWLLNYCLGVAMLRDDVAGPTKGGEDGVC